MLPITKPATRGKNPECLLTSLFGRESLIAELEDFDDDIVADPYISGTNNRRSDKDLARMLDLIDSLPISDNGKEGQA